MIERTVRAKRLPIIQKKGEKSLVWDQIISVILWNIIIISYLLYRTIKVTAISKLNQKHFLIYAAHTKRVTMKAVRKLNIIIFMFCHIETILNLFKKLQLSGDTFDSFAYLKDSSGYTMYARCMLYVCTQLTIYCCKVTIRLNSIAPYLSIYTLENWVKTILNSIICH